MWTDDPHFNPYYHIRHTALPRPADEAALKRLAGRVFSQRLDRSKPLWEIWLVQSHVRRPLRADREDPPRARGRDLGRGHHHRAVRRRPRTRADGAAVAVERQAAAGLGEAARRGADGAHDRPRRDGAGRPRAAARARAAPRPRSRTGSAASAATTFSGINAPAPPSPFNVEIGPHRRYTFLDADLTASKRSRTRSAAPSTTPSSRPSRSRWAATCAATATTPRASC